MSVRRTAAKRDANERDIIEVLRAAGCSVQQLSARGVPDLLVGYEDMRTGEPRNVLMEVKTPKGKLTPDEREWLDAWRGQVVVVRSVDDALRVIGRAA